MDGEGRASDLLKNLEPHILSPVRGDGCQHQSLKLDVAQDSIAVHAKTGSGGSLTVGVTSSSEVIQARLQSKLEVGATENVSNAIPQCQSKSDSLLVVLLGLTNKAVQLVVEQVIKQLF